MNKLIVYRQGDVLIQQVSEIPATAKRQPKKGPVILAEGEVTGHHHAIRTGNVAHYREPSSPVSYIEVAEALAALTHEEHAPIQLPPGRYKVSIQREYHPEAIRRVLD